MKSVGSRMDFARNNNQYVALLLKDRGTYNKNAADNLDESRNPSAPTTRSPTPTQDIPNYICICDRKSQVFECKKCKMYIYGRVSEVCRAHPNVTYLLDLFYCPSCLCSKDNLEVLSN